ncbi:TetR/AcrR family transcriptional regulator, partial [Pseudomonas aeruginosa]
NSIVTGKELLSDADYDAAVETFSRLVLNGCTPDGESGKSAGRLRPLPL